MFGTSLLFGGLSGGASPYQVSFLSIAGGGGQGSGGCFTGGGAGGYLNSYLSEPSGANSATLTPLTMQEGDTLSILVGAGGGTATRGGNTTISGTSLGTAVSYTSIGGGAGANAWNNPGMSGGSGGGGNADGYGSAGNSGGAGTANQGTNGSYAYFSDDGMGCGYTVVGGGGGAGGAAPTIRGICDTFTSTVGGPGLSSSITGASVTRAHGGGSYTDGTNYGQKGDGAARFTSTGNSGVVILRMPTSSYTGLTTGSPVVTTDGDDTVLQFNGSGTYTA